MASIVKAKVEDDECWADEGVEALNGSHAADAGASKSMASAENPVEVVDHKAGGDNGSDEDDDDIEATEEIRGIPASIRFT